MNKLKLRIQDLLVESFDTAVLRKGRGGGMDEGCYPRALPSACRDDPKRVCGS